MRLPTVPSTTSQPAPPYQALPRAAGHRSNSRSRKLAEEEPTEEEQAPRKFFAKAIEGRTTRRRATTSRNWVQCVLRHAVMVTAPARPQDQEGRTSRRKRAAFAALVTQWGSGFGEFAVRRSGMCSRGHSVSHRPMNRPDKRSRSVHQSGDDGRQRRVGRGGWVRAAERFPPHPHRSEAARRRREFDCGCLDAELDAPRWRLQAPREPRGPSAPLARCAKPCTGAVRLTGAS